MAPKTVLITGCSSGIGRSTALAFHEAGWDVYATARTPGDIEPLADRGMATLELDVTEDAHVEAAVEAVVAEGGGIDCLVNNAGYAETAVVEDISIEALTAQFEVNTYGPLRLMRAALPHMREQESGTIVNVSSVGGRIAQPGLGAYCASKFALEAFSDSCRVEVAQFGIDVVLVEPGPVQTPFEDKTAELIDERHDPDHPYASVYEGLDEYNDSIAERGGHRPVAALMGAVTLSPDDIARTILEAATAEQPRARYAGSPIHRLMAMGDHLPDRVLDWVFKQAI
ncbi:MAG: SDR family oxidoreductase [Natrialbaceae archaeon]|nr:SDR family oxidoreductase [Natrialbaceae archaeon]